MYMYVYIQSAKPRAAGCSLPLLAQPLVARHLLVQVRCLGRLFSDQHGLGTVLQTRGLATC